MTPYSKASVFGNFIYIGNQYRYYKLMHVFNQDEDLSEFLHFDTEQSIFSQWSSITVSIWCFDDDIGNLPLTSLLLRCFCLLYCGQQCDSPVAYILFLCVASSVLGNYSYFVYFCVLRIISRELQKCRDTMSALVSVYSSAKSTVPSTKQVFNNLFIKWMNSA